MADKPAFSDQSFHNFLAEEKLMGCRCSRCDSVFLPPKPICTNCFSPDMAWEKMPDVGKLAAFTCITIGPPAMRKEGFGRKNPYCVGVVELAEGLRIDARIVGVDTQKPEEIRVGMPMRADYIQREGDRGPETVLGFRPA